jgi:hypothetical protein
MLCTLPPAHLLHPLQIPNGNTSIERTWIQADKYNKYGGFEDKYNKYGGFEVRKFGMWCVYP